MTPSRIFPRALPCAIALACASGAFAQGSPTPAVSLASAVYVEHAGNKNRSLEPARRLNRGDRVVTVVTWYRLGGGSGGFTVTNPLPRAIAYQESAQDGEQVSIDGGRSWGRLGELRIGTRIATPEDVTHIRWRVPASRAAQGRGNIAYSGIVR